MSLLVWNCHGLRNPRKIQKLGDYILAKDPSVLFLAETWTEDARLDIVLRNFDFNNRWSIPSESRRGCLVLLWKDSINLTIVNSSKYYIDAFINRYTKNAWRFTGFYEEPVTWRRHEAWSKLSALNTYPTIP